MRSLAIRSRIISCFRRNFCSAQVREISPKYEAIFNREYQFPRRSVDVKLVFDEIIRCNAFKNREILEKCLNYVESQKNSKVSPTIILPQTRLIALTYFWTKDPELRKRLKKLIEKHQISDSGIFGKTNDSIINSIISDSDTIPDFSGCLYKSDLAYINFRKEMERKNWENLKVLTEKFGDFLDLYSFSDEIQEVCENVAKKQEVFDVFLNFSISKNKYFMEKEDWERGFSKILRFCGIKYEEIDWNHTILKEIGKTYVSQPELKLLTKFTEDFVKKRKESYVKIKEMENARNFAQKKMKQYGLEKAEGEDVIVVDALNYGKGRDPKNFEKLKNDYKLVVFATRKPPKVFYDNVVKRYNGNALFCNQLSTDDLIVLRIALEFGRKTKILTNDLYREHREFICSKNEQIVKIWDDWMIDATYRHDDGRVVETPRPFNLRLSTIGNSWIVPVISSSSDFRKIQMFHLTSK